MVLPEPISPVITTKPSVNQMVDSMYALARACCLRQVQELRVRAEPERQFLEFERLEVHASLDVTRDRCYGMRTPDGQIRASRRRARASRRGRGRLDERAMADLAPRPRLLAVVVQVQPRHAPAAAARGGMRPIRLIMALWPRGARRAERQAEDGAQVILELAGDRALDGPVAGVMHPRRHLVGDQPPARTKNSMVSTPT